MNYTHLGKNIKTVRKRNKMTQQKLADAIGINLQSLSRIERGVNYPTFATLEKIMTVLDVAPNELLLEDDEIGKLSVGIRRKNGIIEKLFNAHIAFDNVKDTEAMYSCRDKLEEKLDSELSELLSDYAVEVRRKGFEEGFQYGVSLMVECLGNS